MASRRVLITGLGPISGAGVGVEPTWAALLAGRSALGAIQAFDASGFEARIASEVRDFKVNDFVPKSYRKATKVMARDIELAVAAADLAARDAGLVTKGTASNGAAGEISYSSPRMGAHIGAGLIAAELDELTSALVEATDEQGRFDIHKWGSQGMTHLTPLWLLKYLPNMLACHVTITHDAQGPSNTITCAEASSGLSIGESLRVIQRNAADMCFCGGAESKVNPMGLLRQLMTGRLNTRKEDQEQPEHAVRPFCQSGAGSAIGEGAGIVVLEAMDTYEQRTVAGQTTRVYAEITGFGSSQTIHPQARSLRPDPQGAGIALAIKKALREADISPDQIDLIIPFGGGCAEDDQAEAQALRHVFGTALSKIPLLSLRAYLGNCGAGSGSLDVCAGAKALHEQTLPAIINCQQPLDGLRAAAAPAQSASLRHVLAFNYSLGGQNAALVLSKYQK